MSKIDISSSKNAVEIEKKVRQIFCLYGPPIILHTDNGKEFKNKHMNKLCEKFKVKHVFGRPRAPWIQGQLERFNQSVKRFYFAYLKVNIFTSRTQQFGRYVDIIHEINYKYNITKHETTKKKPFKIFFNLEDKIYEGNI